MVVEESLLPSHVDEEVARRAVTRLTHLAEVGEITQPITLNMVSGWRFDLLKYPKIS